MITLAGVGTLICLQMRSWLAYLISVLVPALLVLEAGLHQVMHP